MRSVISAARQRSVLSSSRSFAFLTKTEILPTKQNYQSQLTELRKQWADDYQKEQQRLSDEKAAQVKRMILQKAMNLRERNIVKVKRAKHHLQRQDKIKQNYMAHVARMIVIENQKNKIRQDRFERLVKLHAAESRYWVTLDNLDKKITPELFETPATTGVTTAISEYWRYCCPTMQPNRTLLRLLAAEDEASDEEGEEEGDEDGKKKSSSKRPSLENTQQFLEPLDYLHHNEEQITTQKESIRSMLNAMIGEGSDREKYETLVNDFVEIAEDLNGPLGEVNPSKRFASGEMLNAKKLTAEDLMELIDHSDPVNAQAAVREVQEFAFAHPSDEFVDIVKSIPLTEGARGATTQQKMAQLKGLLLPEKKPDEDDSDYNFSDDEGEPTPPSSSATVAAPKSQYFASAESLTFDDLIEDIDYLDLNNLKEVKQLYERMKGKVRKGSK